jgi:ATP-binding cassette subfamily F protein 3
MAHIVLRDIDKAYAGAPVLTRVSLAVGHRERIGLVGRNGEGKTTLLRIMAGLEDADLGSVERAGGVRVGLLDQTRPLDFAGTLEQAMLAEFGELQDMEAELRALEECMADPRLPGARGRDPDALVRAYAGLTERFEVAGGYGYRTLAAQALTGLGFRQPDFARPVPEFSGGERVRGALARLLLAGPELLLLDEPTNHLDLAATEWLETFLGAYRGAVVIVSHDRYFLDRLANRMAELEGGRLRTYDGNYTDFIRQKEEELVRDAARARELRGKSEQLRAFVAKFSAGTRSVQAKSKAKMLRRVEMEAESLRRRSVGRPGFRFEARQASGREVLSVRDLSLSAGAGAPNGERRLFARLSFAVRAHDRLALVGPNGCGKTTLLRALLGQHEPDAGEIRWGHGVSAAYLRQDLGDLADDETVLDELIAASGMLPGEARDLLGSFQFRGDDVHKRIGDLSGGERCRLAMANMLVSGANVLVLDEPTNHLDITARAALEEALAAYAGTVVFVSHDRYFIDRVATSVLAFEAEGPSWHAGNFSSYRAARQQRLATPRAGEPATAGPVPAGRRAEGGRRNKGVPVEAAAQIAALMAERASLETEMARDRSAGRPRLARERLARYREIESLIRRLESGCGGPVDSDDGGRGGGAAGGRRMARR